MWTAALLSLKGRIFFGLTVKKAEFNELLELPKIGGKPNENVSTNCFR